MYNLYVFMLCKISENYTEAENAVMFSYKDSLISLLCISVELFEFSYKSLFVEYKRYTNIFEIDLISGFKPINWVGKKCKDLPQTLLAHLYDLERQVIIR